MSVEDTDMNRKPEALDKEIRTLVDGCTTIMNWDIPEIDEPRARRLMLDESKAAIGRLGSQISSSRQDVTDGNNAPGS